MPIQLQGGPCIELKATDFIGKSDDEVSPVMIMLSSLSSSINIALS